MELEFGHIVRRFAYHNERTDNANYSIEDREDQSYIDFYQKKNKRIGMQISNDEELSINKVARNWTSLAIFTKGAGRRKGDKIKHISLYLRTLKRKL